ncbi:MAG: tRNA lysidine(34) synthetase TilS [Pirellulales bacterium]
MPLAFDNLESALADAWPTECWREVNVLLAVSGGADSVALLRAAMAAKEAAGGAGSLAVAHFDHRIRAESAADSAWLAKLCGELDVPLEIGAADVLSAARRQGDGLEAAARQLRYDFLRQTAEKLGARFVAVAHTRDDQVETVLHRILRGTGVTGLRGMSKARPLSASVTVIRPLLQVGRGQVLDYLRRIGQDFRTDTSNADEQFTRNRLRLRLLPLLRAEFNPDVEMAILRLCEQADDVQQVIHAAAGELVETAFSIALGRIECDAGLLREQPLHLVREACKLAWEQAGLPLQAMGFAEWQQLAKLVTSPGDGSLNLPGDVRVLKAGDQVQASRLS